MIKLLAGILAGALALVGAPPAHAQNTQSALTGFVTGFFPDNTSGLITPANTRTMLNSMILSTTCPAANQIVIWGTLGLPGCVTSSSSGVLGWNAGTLSVAQQIILGVNGGTGGQITLNGATSGSAVINVPAVAGSTAVTLPSSNGVSGQVFTTNGAGVTSWGNSTTFNDITSGAACNYRFVFDGAMGSGSTTLTSATAAFTAADVGRYIAVQAAGAASVTLFTTISGFTNSTTVTLSAANASGGSISGKIVELGTDDTTVLNANIVTAYAAHRNGLIPAAKSCLVSRLNLTGMSGFTLQGPGVNQGAVGPSLAAMNDASYGTATGHLIDTTGSAFLIIRDLQVGGFYVLPRPTTGVFMAQIASGVSNRITLGPNLYISGQFSNTTVYDYGVPSSTCLNADFYNYASGAGTQNVTRFANTNISSLTSSFATVTSGTLSTSDWHLYNCEWHKFAGAGANNEVILLSGTTNLAFYGGVISGGATQYVTFASTASNISFNNTTFETESEPVTPTNVFFLNNGATVAGIEWPQSSFIKGGNLVGLTGTGTISTFKKGTPYLANSAGGMNPATSLTYFFGTGVNDTVAASNAFSLTAGGTVFANMQCRTSASAGGGFNYVETFQSAGADTALTCTLANPATTCSDTAHVGEATAAGTGMNLKHVASNAGASTTRAACSVEMQPY